MTYHVRDAVAVLGCVLLTAAVWAADAISASASFAGDSLASGGTSAAALYNSANGYARAGKPGLAVLYYERARLIDPTDADVDANLDHVRKAASLPSPPLEWYGQVASRASPLAFAVMGIVGLILCGASLLSLRGRQTGRGVLRLAACLGFIAMCMPLIPALEMWPLLHSGVVIVHSAEARVSPVSLGDPVFTVPEGDLVRIASTHQGYVLVRTRAGKSGWLAAESVARIVP